MLKNIKKSWKFQIPDVGPKLILRILLFLQFVGGFFVYLNVYDYFPMRYCHSKYTAPETLRIPQPGRNPMDRKAALVVLWRCYWENYPHSPRRELQSSRNISDCSHFLILVSIRTALLTNLKFGEGWSQPSNETQNLVDRSWRPKNIIQYYYHAIWKWYIYTYICIKNIFEQYLYQYNESNIIFTHLSICFRMF